MTCVVSTGEIIVQPKAGDVFTVLSLLGVATYFRTSLKPRAQSGEHQVQAICLFSVCVRHTHIFKASHKKRL